MPWYLPAKPSDSFCSEHFSKLQKHLRCHTHYVLFTYPHNLPIVKTFQLPYNSFAVALQHMWDYTDVSKTKWHPTPVLLPGKSHGWGSPVGYTVHGVAKSWTRPRDFTVNFHFHALEKEMATHSSVLAWRIPGTREPGGLPSVGSHRVGHDWSNLAAAADCCLASTGDEVLITASLLSDSPVPRPHFKVSFQGPDLIS